MITISVQNEKNIIKISLDNISDLNEAIEKFKKLIKEILDNGPIVCEGCRFNTDDIKHLESIKNQLEEKNNHPEQEQQLH